METIIIPRSTISSREYIKHLLENVRKDTNIDFEKVTFISRSAAHEFVKTADKLRKQNIKLKAINTADDISQMIRIVNSSFVLS